jgi:hypothetical protein
MAANIRSRIRRIDPAIRPIVSEALRIDALYLQVERHDGGGFTEEEFERRFYKYSSIAVAAAWEHYRAIRKVIMHDTYKSNALPVRKTHAAHSSHATVSLARRARAHRAMPQS